MSYEGWEEFLCEGGHYFTESCYGPTPKKCPRCLKSVVWFHSVDETNGINEYDTSTFKAPIKKIGLEDEWRVDRHGNKYAVTTSLWTPDSQAWKKIG